MAFMMFQPLIIKSINTFFFNAFNLIITFLNGANLIQFGQLKKYKENNTIFFYNYLLEN